MKSSSYFPALTGLRAVAAFMVFFHHFPIPAKRAGWFIETFCSELYVGVSIFFVLSGFLITIRYEELFVKGDVRFKNYFLNRFARIYPLYFIITTITFIFSSYSLTDVIKGNVWMCYFVNVTLLKGFFDMFIFTGIAPGWTLTVEECFYLIAPFIFIFFRKVRWFWAVIILYICGFGLVAVSEHINFYGFFDSNIFMFVSTFFGRCFEFFIGVQVARFLRAGKTYNCLGNKMTYTGIAGIFIIVILLMFSISDDALYQYGLYSKTGAIINNFLLPVFIGLFLLGLVKEDTIISRLLSSKTFILLGKSSYAFYLIHMGIIQELLYRFVFHNRIYSFPLLVLISIVLFKILEEPLNKSIRRLSI